MITFDEFLETITGEREPEFGFSRVQGSAHTFAALMWEWSQDNVTNAQAIEIANFDSSDTELVTVKIYLNGLSKADILSLEDAMILASEEISATGITYDKALLRARFGLS